MLTIFAIPKDFDGHSDVIQRNAIRSWRQVVPNAQILLFGSAKGCRALAEEVGAEHIGDLAKNEYGTPLVSETFRQATRRANCGMLCYLNADIILTSDILDAVAHVPPRQYVLSCRRWNMCIDEPLEYDEGWEASLRHRTSVAGHLGPPTGMDCFVFPKDSPLPEAMPDFVVGRAGWDNWVVVFARKRRIPFIDATGRMLIVHQDHGYGHVPDRTNSTWEGPESDYNRSLFQRNQRAMTLLDATHTLTDKGLRRAWGGQYLRHRLSVARQAMTDNIPGLGRLLRLCRRRP